MYKLFSNSNLTLKKIIIVHIYYSKQKIVPSTSHTQNIVWIKACPIIIVFKSIAILKWLVIYYYDRIDNSTLIELTKTFTENLKFIWHKILTIPFYDYVIVLSPFLSLPWRKKIKKRKKGSIKVVSFRLINMDSNIK